MMSRSSVLPFFRCPNSLSLEQKRLALNSELRYDFLMERVFQRFKRFQAAERADAAYYRSLSPEQRLEILFSLVDQGDEQNENQQGFERVYRIVELAQS